MSERRVWLARREKLKRSNRYRIWGALFGEMEAQGWTPVRVNPVTGNRVGKKAPGVWVFRYVGRETDGPVRFAKRCTSIVLQDRELKEGEE